jgi:UDP:flavonoid glycosyltransferase YjiC (YdhE family)
MAKLLWLNWSGGGNLPPSLGIARVLEARGHEVSFAGRPEMAPRVKTAGFRAIEIDRAYEQLDGYPAGTPLTRMACYLTSPAVEAQVSEIVAAEAPDLVLIDGLCLAALNQASGFGRPSAVFIHTFVHRQLDMWRGMLGRLAGMRVEAGYSPLPAVDDLWRPRERLISTSLAAFDTPVQESWPNLVHVGPALENEKAAVPTPLPWPDDDARPLVLVSFSTGFEQRNVDKLQRALDGLADLPLRVVATTGGVVAPHELAAPANAIVLNYAAHDPILARASAVLGHGGHGTAMRAMRHGVPMAIIPGIAGDQPYVAKAVEEWGAGLALPADADAGVIAAAIGRLIAERAFRQEARRRAQALAGVDGATGAADVVEAMLA